MDIAMLSDFDMYRAYENEGLLSVDELEIPNMANVYEQFRFSYAVPHIFSSMVLVYNTEAVKTPTDSFGVALETELDRKSVVEGKRVSERVDHGGRRILTKHRQRELHQPNS